MLREASSQSWAGVRAKVAKYQVMCGGKELFPGFIGNLFVLLPKFIELHGANFYSVSGRQDHGDRIMNLPIPALSISHPER